MAKNRLVAPVLKWVGGKRQLLDEILPLMPTRINNYCEPFVGGGAVLFNRQPRNIYINDINSELINVYKVIYKQVEELIECLGEYKNTKECFYTVRELDRDKLKYDSLNDVEKAARIIFLNKTCYNGLYRVNNAGEFNTPFGNYKNPNIVNAPVLRAVSRYFNDSNIYFYEGDYSAVLNDIPNNSFVYLDPPYDPISVTSSFTGYSAGGFSKDEQIRLRQSCDRLTERGIKFLLSNSSTPFIHEQYSEYNINVVRAKRAINSIASKRGDVDEVLIKNY